jgi:Fur family transcriptional regulator, peroxide stress response regulator
MALAPDEIQHRMTRFKEALARAGVKLTHQRLEIFSEVARTGEHPDAETVFRGVRERLPTVSLDTVYRTLWLLIDLGVLITLGPPRGRVRFDANMRPHHHFVCVHCGRAHDFYSPVFDALQIPAAVKAWGRVERTLVEIRGLCARCMKEKKGK